MLKLPRVSLGYLFTRSSNMQIVARVLGFQKSNRLAFWNEAYPKKKIILDHRYFIDTFLSGSDVEK